MCQDRHVTSGQQLLANAPPAPSCVYRPKDTGNNHEKRADYGQVSLSCNGCSPWTTVVLPVWRRQSAPGRGPSMAEPHPRRHQVGEPVDARVVMNINIDLRMMSWRFLKAGLRAFSLAAPRILDALASTNETGGSRVTGSRTSAKPTNARRAPLAIDSERVDVPLRDPRRHGRDTHNRNRLP